MDNIGIDLHQRESQLCILTQESELIERRGAPPDGECLVESPTSAVRAGVTLRTPSGADG